MTQQLDILNHVLSVVGEAPVSSPTSNNPTAQTATNTINRVNRQFQLRGWWFNKDIGLALAPNADGEIILPDGTLKVSTGDTTNALIQRGSRLYNRVLHTYNINDTVTVNIIIKLNPDDLPEAASAYLMHKSAYDFYVNDDGDELKAKLLLMEVRDAWGALTSHQLQMSKTNALNRPTAQALRSGIQQWTGGRNANIIGGGN